MIIVNCRFLTQPLTGVQRYAEELLTALASIRDDLVLVAPHATLRRQEIAGLRVTPIGSHTGHRWEQQDLLRFVRSRRRGAILLSLTNTGPVLLRSQIVTHHDVTYVRHPQTYSRTFRLGYRLLSTLTLRSARRVITVSDFSRREIADVYGLHPDRISVVPNAASNQFAATARSEAAEPYFLAVASVLPHKNLALLVRSFLSFADATGSSTRLQLVGSKIRMSAEHEIVPEDDRVTWLGRVSDRELVALYKGARALVFPSLYEGFGVPPLEAQACGCPVISSDAASLPEVLGDSAVLFPPTDESALVRCLTEVDTNTALRKHLQKMGYANAGRFSWVASAHTLNSILNDTLRNGSRAR